MAYKPTILNVAAGGTNASSFSVSNGVAVYDGTRLVTPTGPQFNASTGVYTNANQPAFLAKMNSNLTNKTGNGASYTLGTDAWTEVYDQGSIFNTNGTMTCGVAGGYLFYGQIEFNNITTANVFDVQLIFSSGFTVFASPAQKSAILDFGPFVIPPILVNMSATQTAQVTVVVSGQGADTVGISGDATNYYTYFGCVKLF